MGTDSIRGRDTLGIDQLAGAAGITNVEVSIDAATSGELSISLGTASPKNGIALASRTSSTSNVLALDVNVKALERGVTVRTLKIQAVDADNTANIVAVKLFDGSTLLASKSLGDADGGSKFATFDNLSVPISKDSTKTFSIKVDLGTINAADELAGKKFLLKYNDITAVDEADQFVTVVTGSATGRSQVVHTKAPIFAFTSANITKTTQAGSADIADATIVFNVTADKGDIYIRKYNGGDK